MYGPGHNRGKGGIHRLDVFQGEGADKYGINSTEKVVMLQLGANDLTTTHGLLHGLHGHKICDQIHCLSIIL